MASAFTIASLLTQDKLGISVEKISEEFPSEEEELEEEDEYGEEDEEELKEGRKSRPAGSNVRKSSHEDRLPFALFPRHPATLTGYTVPRLSISLLKRMISTELPSGQLICSDPLPQELLADPEGEGEEYAEAAHLSTFDENFKLEVLETLQGSVMHAGTIRPLEKNMAPERELRKSVTNRPCSREEKLKKNEEAGQDEKLFLLGSSRDNIDLDDVRAGSATSCTRVRYESQPQSHQMPVCHDETAAPSQFAAASSMWPIREDGSIASWYRCDATALNEAEMVEALPFTKPQCDWLDLLRKERLLCKL
ncbi:unnamed protein product [Protopolystoma xenopodis]|uniref:Uncharacterized protein n=1 Tax=Protopolystoma xenopodis TaxID=117903 RepID=A0A3S5B1R7_9PLAT|nr:unnamed protein product [Protopolystoma xenopodis]